MYVSLHIIEILFVEQFFVATSVFLKQMDIDKKRVYGIIKR